MKKEDNQYNYANLSEAEINQVNSLEKTISAKKREEVILVAYQGNEAIHEKR